MQKQEMILIQVPASELEIITREVHKYRDFLFDMMPSTAMLAYFTALHLLPPTEREAMLTETPESQEAPDATS